MFCGRFGITKVGKPAQSHQAWDDEAEAKLRSLAEAGASTQEVAKALGRSQQSVATRANKLGFSLRSAPIARRGSPKKGDAQEME